MQEANSKRIFYLDALRGIAILCVVLLHVTGNLAEIMNYNASTIHSFSGVFEIFANNFFRIGVDLFLLLSGSLLLGRDWTIKGFLSKRIPRVIKPFIFWSSVFSVMLFLFSYFIPSVSFITEFGIYNMLKLFYDTLMCTAPGSSIYWFFWMLIGVYLIMPVFNGWIKYAELSEVEYFLVIWIVSTIFEYSLMIDFPIKLYYFTSPIGLVLLGYYLRYGERKVFNNSIIAIFLITVPSIIMFVYSFCIVDVNVLFEFHRYSIFEIVEVIGVFCLFKNSTILNNPNDFVKKLISSIAMCSYGMYLTHSQIIMIVRRLLPNSLNFTFDYVLLFIVGFIGSWLIILILSKIPIIEDYVGVK